MIQEEKSKRSLRRLNLETVGKVEVIRDGAKMKIDAIELTINDLVILKMGDVVGCDLEVVRHSSNLVDESILTGESEPVIKEVGSHLSMGSTIKAGMIEALVIKLAKDD